MELAFDFLKEVRDDLHGHSFQGMDGTAAVELGIGNLFRTLLQTDFQFVGCGEDEGCMQTGEIPDIAQNIHFVDVGDTVPGAKVVRFIDEEDGVLAALIEERNQIPDDGGVGAIGWEISDLCTNHSNEVYEATPLGWIDITGFGMPLWEFQKQGGFAGTRMPNDAAHFMVFRGRNHMSDNRFVVGIGNDGEKLVKDWEFPMKVFFFLKGIIGINKRLVVHHEKRPFVINVVEIKAKGQHQDGIRTAATVFI